MARQFADLHCHPTMFGFHRLRNDPEAEADPDRFHPWHVHEPNFEHMRRGKRAAQYSQCCFPQLAHSDTRLVFASITPIERGFFQGSDEEVGNFVPELLELVSGVTIAKSAAKLVRGKPFAAARELLGVARNRGPVRALIHRTFLKYGKQRVEHLLSRDYDYWEEFEREYDFLRRRNGDKERVEVPIPSEEGRREVDGCYHLVDGPDTFESVARQGDDVAVLLSIEGGHVFSIGPDGRRVDEATIFERIRRLKDLEHPVFYLTLAHHFDNGICGHARSLIDLANLVMDQRPRMHEGFEPDGDLGLRVVRELLDLDDALQDRGGRRILIDTRHMSPRTRQQYYNEVVRPYNARHADKSARERRRFPKIPVISSHSAHTGVRHLSELVANAEHENDHWHRNPFYAWGLNTADEDVRMVHQSEGLYGVSFDQRIVGVPPFQKVPEHQWPHIMLNQIFGVVDVIMDDDRLSPASKRTIWDRICIGSDFDGMIDPVSRYSTAVDFRTFADDLRRLFRKYRHTRMIEQIGVDELVEKIAWKNAYAFARRHLPSVVGG
ncbi:hypothetical protein FIV42_01100 [Persicimonas caeni]|uniref:Peptidase M19 n=1 Tax=Persicimonas caeni TaxID=2292766 RepID=A0A4Y6PMA6_PERCE|nr:hypothetical protein [Persicimonas caeni]QDG49380.1 hypothetical protein FIV42_01100 [Persicimonas caeni]QED30601.1 hypothetical protein FRD00_01095 [Persicimonas caeni]